MQARAAPATSNSRMLPIEVRLISSAPRAGPAMLDSEAMIWLTPAMRVSCDCGGQQRDRGLHGGHVEGRARRTAGHQDVDVPHLGLRRAQNSAASASVQRAMKLSARIIVRLRSQRST